MKKGFTLLETMVAITILSFAIAGPLYAASRSLLAAQLARDRLTASYLAQEGIEYMRLVRDTIFIGAYRDGMLITTTDKSIAAWENFEYVVQSATNCRDNYCMVDQFNAGNTLVSCGSALITSCPVLNLSTNRYVQGGTGVPTKFRRAVQVTDVVVNPNDKKVTSTVTWDFHGTTYTITLTSHLTPWK